MVEWYCYKDKVRMSEAEMTLTYLELTQRIYGLRCPKCGASYLTEDTVMTNVHEAEIMIEQK
jgi:uncharacterized OB-fold protein